MVKCFSLLMLPLLAAAQLKMVSQTFNGVGVMTVETKPAYPGLPSLPLYKGIVKMSRMMDKEAVRYREDRSILVNMSGISSREKQSVIFDASTRRMTVFIDQELTGSVQLSTKTCTVVRFPNPLQQIEKCIEDALANLRHVGPAGDLDKDALAHSKNAGPWDQYEMQVPMDSVAATEAFYVDKENVLKKIAFNGDVTLPSMGGYKYSVELTDLNSTAGTPRASVFTPPAEWGNCTEISVLAPLVAPVLAQSPKFCPSLQALIKKCVGISNEHAPTEEPTGALMGLLNFQSWSNPQVAFLSFLAMGCLAFAAVFFKRRATARAAHGTTRTLGATPFIAEHAIEMNPVQEA